MLPIQDRTIVATAMARCFAAVAAQKDAELPPQSVRWAAYVERTRQSLARLSTPLEALHFAQSQIGFGSSNTTEKFAPLLGLVEGLLYNEFPQYRKHIDQFADIAHNFPGTVLMHKGRPVGNILFLHARYVLNCLTHLPPPDTVLEIGGGYGAPARLWALNPIHRPRRQILVDIPESLFFADVFLSSEFSPDEVGYVTSPDPADMAALDKFRFVLCPLHCIEALKAYHVDLVINTGSMQEMSEDWVDFYTGWLDQQPCRFFYSLNYFAQPVSFLAESANLWSPRLSARWKARLLTWNPDLVRTYTTRNFLEMIAERVDDAPMTPDDAAAAWMRVAERVMTGQTLVEMMDIVRRCPHEELMFHTMRRGATGIIYHPKEVLYLANQLAESASRDFYAAHREDIDAVRTHFAGERAKGKENVY